MQREKYWIKVLGAGGTLGLNLRGVKRKLKENRRDFEKLQYLAAGVCPLLWDNHLDKFIAIISACCFWPE